MNIEMRKQDLNNVHSSTNGSTLNVNTFKIAELPVCIRFKDSPYNSMKLLPSFEPFRSEI